ncbi:hypothetical protein FOL47_002007 [Perkinsus chesapeaki]|uniref:Peptidase A1 domain-containing protein n=1 Tax=Perkinsus chesapeaki TaxID=330153 RepID=A0A7J6KR62_PERCH|nr:hypothetical protein FOL47_002007 [Perkinsus chesapeaki]
MGQVLDLDIRYGNLGGYGIGLFCVVGFPGYEVSALVDTGSTSLFFVWKEWYEREVGVGACDALAAGCYSCPGIRPPDDPYVIVIEDGMAVGVFNHEDSIKLGSVQIPRSSFGLICNQYPSPLVEKSISILGLAPFADGDFDSLLHQLANARPKRISSMTFAIYLKNDKFGKLLLGGGDPNLYKNPLRYVSFTSQEEYTVKLSYMQVGDGRLTIGIDQNVLLDTGSNSMYVPQIYFNGILSEIRSQASNSAGIEIKFTWDPDWRLYTFSCKQRAHFPAITFYFGAKGEVPLVLLHNNYVRQYRTTDQCGVIISTETSRTEPRWTLPGDAFIGKYFEFHPEKGRVGIANLAIGVS